MAASKSSGGHPWLKRIVVALIAAVAASVVARRKALAPAPQFDLQLSARPEPPSPPAPSARQEAAPPVRLVSQAATAPAETPNSTPDKPSAAASDLGVAGDAGAPPQADTATDAETDGEASIQANAEADVDADIAADTEAGSDATVDADAEANLDADAEADTKAATEAGTAADSETTDGVATEELDDLQEDEAESDAGLPMADDPVSAALNSGAGYLRMTNGERTCPEAFPIKGNASSHIYHRPGESSYEATIPEICFADEGIADSMGYRPRKH